MPDTKLIVSATVLQRSAVVLTARCKDVITGTAIVPADITSCRMRVYELASKSATTGTLVNPLKPGDPGYDAGYDGDDIAPADIILPALEVGGYLDEDGDGINIRYVLDKAYLPNAFKVYRVEMLWTPSDASATYYPPVWELTTKPVFSEIDDQT